MIHEDRDEAAPPGRFVVDDGVTKRNEEEAAKMTRQFIPALKPVHKVQLV
jgi:hypothetical protein